MEAAEIIAAENPQFFSLDRNEPAVNRHARGKGQARHDGPPIHDGQEVDGALAGSFQARWWPGEDPAA